MFKGIDFKRLIEKDYRNRILDKYKPYIKKFSLPAVIVICLIAIWVTSGNNENNIANAEITDNNEIIEEINSSMFYVDICGEVINPGVYPLKEGSRIFQVIEMAGGLTTNAYIRDLNQAEIIYDGQKIYIPSKDEVDTVSLYSQQSGLTNGKVNLNKADLDTLQTLPGIGISKAQRIIEYRENTGKFKKAEDIMNVSGIGESTYASLKDLICV